MSNEKMSLWSEFLEVWPPDRVRSISLEEYTNLNRDDAFIYWLESRTGALGSIWGGSGFKFGIYRRAQTDPKEPSGGRIFGDEYAWMRKYGETADAAFATVRSLLIQIIEAAGVGDLAAIDEVDLGPTVKWKIACLYQDRETPRIFSVYNTECLQFHYELIDASSKGKDVPQSVLYTTLMDRYRDLGDVFEIGSELWRRYREAPEPTDEKKATPEHSELPPSDPKNIILYGPPGTGKTWSTVRRALELVLGEPKVREKTEEDRFHEFQRLQEEGRIEFVTFHQAYGYEEFVEGIRPILGTGGDDEIHYELHDSVFKRIALRAATAGLAEPPREEPTFETVWRELVDAVAGEEDRVVDSSTDKTYILRTTSRGNLEAVHCELDEEGAVAEVRETRLIASKANVRLVWEHRHELGLEPSEISAAKTTRLFARERGGGGGHHYTAIWIVYRELLQLARAREGRPTAERDLLERVQQILDEPTSGMANFRFTAATLQYVLVVDEINRGNVSKILGELITLLEPDKRLGGASELRLPLSYSPDHRFAVPPNLHILGTMNTADRSVALMDVALRRRFTFKEMMPDSEVLRSVLGKKVKDEAFVELTVDLMETMNRRIRFLYDRDHQIGHSYFLVASDYEELRRVFVDRLVPLLQEYFYGAWDKICTVLGCPIDESGKPIRTGPSVASGSYVAPIVLAEVFSEEATLGFDHDDYEDRLDYRVAPEMTTPHGDQEVLLPFFLSVLDLNQNEWSNRQQSLESGPILDNASMRT